MTNHLEEHGFTEQNKKWAYFCICERQIFNYEDFEIKEYLKETDFDTSLDEKK